MRYRPVLMQLLFGSLNRAMIPFPLAFLWALFARGPLHEEIATATVFIGLHAIGIATVMGQTRSSAFAFLNSRGFGRDELWLHTMLASAAAVLVVWLPAALVVWSGARAFVGDQILESPYQPLMWPREVWAPLYWLAGYALVLPVFHYAWIRAAQPVSWPTSGIWLAAAYVLTVFGVWNTATSSVEAALLHRMAVVIFATTISLVLLAAGRHLYRRLEVVT